MRNSIKPESSAFSARVANARLNSRVTRKELAFDECRNDVARIRSRLSATVNDRCLRRMSAKTTARAQSSDRYNFSASAITIDPRDSSREYPIESLATHRGENIGKHIEDRASLSASGSLSLLSPHTLFGSELPEREPAVRLFADIRSAGNRAKNLSKTSSAEKRVKGGKRTAGRMGLLSDKVLCGFRRESGETVTARGRRQSSRVRPTTNSGYFDRP
jgi:hypothetical protein